MFRISVDALTYYVVGHAGEEQLAAGPAGGDEAVARLSAALDPGRHPNMAAASGDLAAPHPEEHFGFGLELIMAGVRARPAASGPPS